MIRAAAAASCLAVCACTPAGAETVSPGVYGDVRLSEESGDLGGIELELIGAGPNAQVEFVFCEGWCSSLHKAPVEFTGEGFAFAYTERFVSQDGSPALALRYEVEAVPIAAGLRVTVTPAGHPKEAFTADLPRIGERFGLAVAAGEN